MSYIYTYYILPTQLYLYNQQEKLQWTKLYSYISGQSNNKFRDRPHMIQAEFENGIEDENNFQIQEIDFQNGIDEDDA